jgi:hypothetical protein
LSLTNKKGLHHAELHQRNARLLIIVPSKIAKAATGCCAIPSRRFFQQLHRLAMSICSNLLTPQCKTALSSTPALTRILLLVNILLYAIGFLVPRDRSGSQSPPPHFRPHSHSPRLFFTHSSHASVMSANVAPGRFCLSAAAFLDDPEQVCK